MLASRLLLLLRVLPFILFTKFQLLFTAPCFDLAWILIINRRFRCNFKGILGPPRTYENRREVATQTHYSYYIEGACLPSSEENFPRR